MNKTAKSAKKKKGKIEHSKVLLGAQMPESNPKPVYIAKVGSVVKSLAGRDKGSLYIIYSIIDANFVYLVDGRGKKITTPKKKKLKHIKLTGDELANIALKIKESKVIHDAEISSALRKLSQV
ncbi:MAG: hypothetical protein FWB72_00925 [Firmicutes bacterium]|nr:hypothetical protein [Bacillota bacterium]